MIGLSASNLDPVGSPARMLYTYRMLNELQTEIAPCVIMVLGNAPFLFAVCSLKKAVGRYMSTLGNYSMTRRLKSFCLDS